DDAMVVAPNSETAREVYLELSKHLKLRNLGQIKKFLGWQVDKTDNGFIVHQSQYIDDLIQQYGISEAGTRKVPMGSFVLHDDSQPVDDNLPVRELVGSLQYLAHKSRPDICASVQFLSRYMHKPTKALFQAAKNVL